MSTITDHTAATDVEFRARLDRFERGTPIVGWHVIPGVVAGELRPVLTEYPLTAQPPR